ncbi:MAG: OsmC family protein [Bacteroidia bacterium]|nr:OsmC family protein [Bacteroidia bacterium]
MHSMTGQYLGGLRTQSTHLKSGNIIITDAPTDNQGKGEAFSPTDTLSAALASCMITIAGIAANTHGFDLTGTNWEVTKVMGTDPRRVTEIHIIFYFPKNNYSEKEKKIIENAILTCPAAKSLHPDLQQKVSLIF